MELIALIGLLVRNAYKLNHKHYNSIIKPLKRKIRLGHIIVNMLYKDNSIRNFSNAFFKSQTSFCHGLRKHCYDLFKSLSFYNTFIASARQNCRFLISWQYTATKKGKEASMFYKISILKHYIYLIYFALNWSFLHK